MAVPKENQSDYETRLAAAEERGRDLLGRLDEMMSSVSQMQRLVQQAITRRQDSRISVDFAD